MHPYLARESCQSLERRSVVSTTRSKCPERPRIALRSRRPAGFPRPLPPYVERSYLSRWHGSVVVPHLGGPTRRTAQGTTADRVEVTNKTREARATRKKAKAQFVRTDGRTCMGSGGFEPESDVLASLRASDGVTKPRPHSLVTSVPRRVGSGGFEPPTSAL
jgi:hypothetical protein